MHIFFESVLFFWGGCGAYLRYCVRLLEWCYTKILMVCFFFLDYLVYSKPLLSF